MKPKGAYKSWLAFSIFFAASCVGGHSGGNNPAKWPKMPNLELRSCVKAKQMIQPDPDTDNTDALMVITAYEEYDNLTHEKSFGVNGVKAMNAYLVIRMFLNREKNSMRIHATALIVEEIEFKTDQAQAPGLKRWALFDQDGDGQMDTVAYGQGVGDRTEDVNKSAKTQIPARIANRMQRYFEEGVRSLSDKVSNDSGGKCRIS